MNIRTLLRKEKIIPDDLFSRIESSGLPLENIGIDVLNLSRRSYNALVISHIDTLDKLIHLTDFDIAKMRNIGATSVEKI